MKRFAAAAISCAILLLPSGVLLAGALDRGNVAPRSNPVAQSMIRVPGVVGQEQAAAMAAIQQAGLNPSILEAKKIPKGMGGAAGMECKVVDQKPSAGGMAMYGTTVTVYVYKPGQCAAGTGGVGGAPSYGMGSTPSYGNPSGFPSGASSVPVQMQPMQGGMMGGPQMQGGQGFQVQQYYFPDPNASAPQGQTSAPPQGQPSSPPPPPQTVDPYTGQPVPQGAPPPPPQ
jgi:hypothetical protein